MVLTKEDICFLENIYKYKTLSLQQVWQIAYKAMYSSVSECVQERIFPLAAEDYVQYLSDKFCGYRIAPTNKGIEAVRAYKDLPKFTKDEWGKEHRTFRTPSELRIRAGLLAHQLSLNDFLVNAKECLDKEVSIKSEIFLEKEVLDYDYFRPDGVISLKNSLNENMQIYVEQDMGTESRAQLLDKWDRYRRFIEYNKGDNELGKKVMLFIIGFDTTVKHPHGLSYDNMEAVIDFREKEVFKTVTTLFPSILDQDFDIYIGTEKEMLAILTEKLLPAFKHENLFEENVLRKHFKKELGYRIFKGNSLTKDFNGTVFSYQMLSPDGEKFVIDDSSYTPLSVVAKAIHMERCNALYLSEEKESGRYTNIIYTKEAEKLVRFMEYSGYKNVKDVIIQKQEV